MLKRLCKQLIEVLPRLQLKPEIIIAYDHNKVDGNQIEQIVKQGLADVLSLIQLKIMPTPGLDYTALKNFGAQNSSNEVIIFIDCDVIPEDGWLESMLEAFLSQDVHVVAGNCFMYTNTIWEKAFSLFWTFPPKSETHKHLYETQLFFANNVAFRRKVLESYPLPTLPQYRGQNIVLSEQLWRNGIRIFRQPKSQVYHPMPQGLKNFVIRALCQGHDIQVARQRARNLVLPIINNDLRGHRYIHRIFSTIRNRYRYVALRPKDMIGAHAIILGYFLVMFIGFSLTSLNPKVIRNSFSSC